MLRSPVLEVLSPGEVKLRDGRSVEFANLDIAATAPCLRVVADAVAELLPYYGSVHRGAGALSQRCTREYEQARETVADLLGRGPDDTVIFTRNTTDAFNLLARALPAGTTVVAFDAEHHANLLPWPRGGARVVRLAAPASPEAAVASLTAALRRIRDPRVLVSVTAASNVTGEVWPVARLAAVAHDFGARIAVDAAQLAPHAPASLAGLGADYVAFSGHKLYAPFGAGVLAGRAAWRDAAEPYLAGGGASAHVADDGAARWASGPARHEAGTPNLLGAVALATALRALVTAPPDEREAALVRRLRAGLARLPHVEELRLFPADAERVGIVSFAVRGADAGEFAVTLGRDHGVGVRAGLFCAHPLTRRLLGGAAGHSGQALRASIGLGTTEEHVDRLLAALR